MSPRDSYAQNNVMWSYKLEMGARERLSPSIESFGDIYFNFYLKIHMLSGVSQLI